MQQGIVKAALVTKRNTVIPDKPNKSDSLYEEVIEKNFQTINELLKKLTSILSKHEEFENQMGNYTKRLGKLQAEMETLHNQHRRDNLFIFSSIDDMKTQLTGLDNHIQIIYDKYKQKGLLQINNSKNRQRSSSVVSSHSSAYSGSKNSINQTQQKIKQDNIESRRMSLIAANISKSQLENKNGTFNSISNSNVTESKKLTKQLNSPLQKEQSKKSLDQSLIQKNISIHASLDNEGILTKIDQNKKRSSFQISRGGKPRQKLSIIEGNDENNPKSTHRKSQLSRASTIHKRMQNSTQYMNELKNNENQMEKFKNALTNEQFENFMKICCQQDKLSAIQNKIQSINQKTLMTNQEIEKIDQKLIHIYQKFSTFATSKKLSEESLSFSKEINKLRQECFTNFANKTETKKAVRFIEGKVKNTMSFLDIEQKSADISSIVSKCLVCNRNASLLDQSTQKKNNSFYASQPSLQRKIGIKQLKKKTIEYLKQEKVRKFSRYEGSS